MRRSGFKPRLRDTVSQNAAYLKAMGASATDIDAIHQRTQAYLPKQRGPRKPRTVADGPSEHQIQTAVIDWWRLAYRAYMLPEFALFAIPNGGARDPITGSRLKAEGVRKGIPDLMLAAPCGATCGLFLEMKVGSKKLTEEQIAFILHAKSAGYVASAHYSAESAIAAIKEYLA